MVGKSISLPQDIENAIFEAIKDSTESFSGFIQIAVIEKLTRRKADKIQDKLIYVILMLILGLMFVVVLRG